MTHLERGREALQEHDEQAEETPRRILPAMGISELMAVAEPEESWMVENVLPTAGNFLLAGYPKTHKTNFILELLVSLASGTRFLGRFAVTRRYRAAAILMEDRPHRVRRRLQRICQAHGVDMEALDGWLFLWFAPPLLLSDPVAMLDLADHVKDQEIEFVHVDNWSYVFTGNSNDSDDVSPALAALSGTRKAREGLTIGLTQHARKASRERDADGERITDMIRNSSAFGAWYDAGMVLLRTNENAPVTVRTEYRDQPSPEPFAFTVEDEHPAGPEFGPYPDGYLRLAATSRPAAQIQREEAAKRFKPEVLQFLESHPGCTKNDLRKIEGDNGLIDAAFGVLCEEGYARFDAPEKRGQKGQCWLTFKYHADHAATTLTAHSGDTTLTTLQTPLKGVQVSAHSELPLGGEVPCDDDTDGAA